MGITAYTDVWGRKYHKDALGHFARKGKIAGKAKHSPNSSTATVKVPNWVSKQVPANILAHLVPIKVHTGDHNMDFVFFAVRSGVEIQVYKKVYKLGRWNTSSTPVVATLGLPSGTVICVNSRLYKQRANQAVVKGFDTTAASCVSEYSGSFTYAKGQVVKPTNGFEMSPSNECHPGIHFYFSKKQANQH